MCCYALSVWREAPFFAPAERAALAWTEAVTEVSAGHVSDEIYRLAREHFDERQLVDLTMVIIAINSWNRLAIAFGAIRSECLPRQHRIFDLPNGGVFHSVLTLSFSRLSPFIMISSITSGVFATMAWFKYGGMCAKAPAFTAVVSDPRVRSASPSRK